MIAYPPPFQELIDALRQLPSVGPRMAERLALHLAGRDAAAALRLERSLGQVRDRLGGCVRCGFFVQKDAPCPVCDDPKRDRTVLCVVEQASDVLNVERSGTFSGLYHALGGRLSPLDGIGPEQLRVAGLLQRVQEERPQETILALGADVEGETTVLYLAPLLQALGTRVSRIATGLPAGGGLEFADSVTLGYALNGRKTL